MAQVLDKLTAKKKELTNSDYITPLEAAKLWKLLAEAQQEVEELEAQSEVPTGKEQQHAGGGSGNDYTVEEFKKAQEAHEAAAQKLFDEHMEAVRAKCEQGIKQHRVQLQTVNDKYAKLEMALDERERTLVAREEQLALITRQYEPTECRKAKESIARGKQRGESTRKAAAAPKRAESKLRQPSAKRQKGLGAPQK